MRSLIVVGAILTTAVAGGFGGYWLGQTRVSQSVGQTTSPVPGGIGEAFEGNAQLTEAIRGIEHRLAALEVRQLYANTAKAEDVPSRAAEPPLDLAAIRERESAKAGAIEAALRTEPRDSAWASAAEHQVQGVVNAASQQGAQYTLRTLKCLTSLCEMVLAASSPDKLGTTALQLPQGIGGMSSLDIAPIEIAADGSATVTYRLFREGYPRPDEGT
jgi:hypothetical protein